MDNKDIITIDCNFLHPKVAAAFLIIENGRAVFIENNTSKAVPILLRTLQENGLSPDKVDLAIVTHLHLDHSAGSYNLLKECKNAKLIVHPRSKRHLADPARLVKSSKAVYGEANFLKIYGEIKAISKDRIQTVDDFQVIQWQGRKLQFLHTKGHANSHISIFDPKTDSIFTGDAFGVSYPELQGKQKPFIFPATVPPEFDANEAILGIKKIVDTGAKTAYLTHFGPFSTAEGAPRLVESLEKIKALIDEAVSTSLFDEALLSFCLERLGEIYEGKLVEKEIFLKQEQKEAMSLELRINAMGISYASSRLRKKSAQREKKKKSL